MRRRSILVRPHNQSPQPPEPTADEAGERQRDEHEDGPKLFAERRGGGKHGQSSRGRFGGGSTQGL